MSGRVPPAILLLGPTASGKTGLALALARQLDCEIISVDSALVYRGMDIGTAKPSAAEQAVAPHHLIDILDPAEPYSAARFRADALRLIDDIRARGRIPVLVGGTLLYFRALTLGLSDLPSADAQLRVRLEAEARTHGLAALHARLAQLDPVTASRLHPNDQQRVQRALEIIELTGIPMSRLHEASHSPAEPALKPPFLKFGLRLESRAELHHRIELRFQQMMSSGFLDEVALLRARTDLHAELPALRAVGYRQLWAHLDGEYGLDEAVSRGIAATRQFAKRQLTWLRSERDVLWLEAERPGMLEQVLSCLRGADPAC